MIPSDNCLPRSGGASGIGLATATHFADAGAYVTIADLQDAAGQQTAADLAAKGCHVSFIHCDTTNWEQSVSAFKHAAAFAPSKSLDVAVLSAGREGDMGSMMEQVLVLPEPSMDSDTIPPQPKQAAIEVNLKGLVNSAWLSLYYMRLPSKVPIAEPTSKALTVVSSIAGYADMPYNQDYNASKCESIVFALPTARNQRPCTFPIPASHLHMLVRSPGCRRYGEVRPVLNLDPSRRSWYVPRSPPYDSPS